VNTADHLMLAPGAPPAHFRRGAIADRHQARRAATVLDLARGLCGRALDYGAGWGDLTARLAPQFEEIVGVDADAERVDFARAEYAPLQFSLCHAERTDFEDQSFDVVCSIVVLPFAPSADQHLAECRRLLRPGGTLVFMIPNPESLLMMIRRWRGRPVYGRRWGGRTRAEVRSFLARNGFAVERESGFYDPVFQGVHNAGDVLLSLMSAVAHGMNLSGRWSYVGFRCHRLP
jgi:2-polyprenyl-3-methyl-5-hydroxy-6-metoxy-1,4-benzoquinol methylase